MANILLVDDSGYARRVMRKTLEAASHTVTEAAGGMAAIESYFVKRPDVVLLDLTMEDLGGIEVLGKLREIDANAKVIVVSADVQSSTEQIVKDAGGIAFFGKPVGTEVLLDKIEEVTKAAS